jgi:hypothetical protein
MSMTSERVSAHTGSQYQVLRYGAFGGTRQYSTIREDGAESLKGLSETAGLPKYRTISAPAFLFADSFGAITKRMEEKRTK